MDTLNDTNPPTARLLGKDLGPAREVDPGKTYSIRIATNQYGVRTMWIDTPGSEPMGITPAPHEQETAYWIVSRLHESSLRNQ